MVSFQLNTENMDRFFFFAQPVAVAVIVFGSAVYLGGTILFSIVIAVVPTVILWLFRSYLALKIFGACLFTIAVCVSLVPIEYKDQFLYVAREILSMDSVQAD